MQYSPLRLTYEQVRGIVDEHLDDWHPKGGMPVPIEDIVDCELKIDIVPLVGLADGDEDHIPESFISKDLSTIYVDKDIYSHPVPHRLRFTLAHELGHLVLHRELLESAEFVNVQGWREYLRNSVTDESYKWLEIQAYWFAGLFLVPAESLATEYNQVVERIAAESGLTMNTLPPQGVDYIARMIGNAFQVSPAVIKKRAKFDKLPEWPNDDA